MFKNLTDFGYQRTAKEAFGFYLAYFFLTLIIAGLAGGLVGAIGADSNESGFTLGTRVGTIIAIVVSIGLAFLVIKEKKQTNNFGYLILVVIAGLVALFFGGLGGLIAAAYLTTRPNMQTTVGGQQVSAVSPSATVSPTPNASTVVDTNQTSTNIPMTPAS